MPPNDPEPAATPQATPESGLTQLPGRGLSRWLLVRGLPRDPQATAHLTAMLVAAVSTVLLVRGGLALAGYPQVGGGGLHIAHVLWGGLLMIVGLVLLLSFVGPVIRPLASVLAGIGIGLFIDEVGKFVTSDNDYFYRPATAIMYVLVVVLVLLVHALHGRRPHHPSEHLAAAVDQAVAGVVGGFTPRRRAAAGRQLHRAGRAPGRAEARALIGAVPDDPVELFDPLRFVDPHRLLARLRLWARREVHGQGRIAQALPTITVAVLLAQIAYSGAQFGVRLVGRLDGPAGAVWRGAPGPIPLVLGLASTVTCLVLVIGGWRLLRHDRLRGFTWFHRSLLVNLLFTRVFEFDVTQFVATVSVLVDVLMLVVVGAELGRLNRLADAAEAQAAIDEEPGTGRPAAGDESGSGPEHAAAGGESGSVGEHAAGGESGSVGEHAAAGDEEPPAAGSNS
ncbi:hypothetical protein AB0I55_18395 [Actinocatenispora sera]|uniref:hypothetical protein n=1 Tax=Actinocatenispora sera TaxID=390989 RepID=UPI0033FC7F3A